MVNPLPINRIYISNAADATPRHRSTVSGGGAMHYVGCWPQVISVVTARVVFSSSHWQPSDAALKRSSSTFNSRKQCGRKILFQVIARQGWAFAAMSMIALSSESYPSNPPLPTLSNSSMYQNNSRMLRVAGRSIVLRLPTLSPAYLTVRNLCCGRLSTLLILLLSLGSPEAIRS